ncbi:MAG: tRNA (N6-isopentenyl adenosine(37)-C2)-methylthiotransferase MiaB [Desulfobacteraceae bacterium 4572_89]|nr:MAG: tRNA (N6-isopentenyl adenosine(37)-C2)-methylthiotransferase MiaB [Desulfobacteraceae bacterium 4572_89]
MTHKGYAYIHTIGCQMNIYDSEKLFIILEEIGYERTDILDLADIVICNTCAIREKAQEKAYSFLGRLTAKKKKKPHLIAVMAGCVAQQEGAKAFDRLSCLDIVLGTHAFARLAGHIKDSLSGRKKITDIEESDTIFETRPFDTARSKVSRFVTIMQGCDNYCTYCVVPYVRGRERSRDPESIVREVTLLAESGVREVTLLGQNVNSYGTKEGTASFPKLLEKVSRIPDIRRIRFATSHPKDLSLELIEAMGDLPKVCNHLHLPVQSGSDRILKKMNRGYTRSIYLDRIAKLREKCPGIALSSDMIVGFPTESHGDFEATLDLIREVDFDGIFAFAYSDRPNAPAAKFSGAVDEDLKMKRLNILLDLQETHTEKKNQALVGKRVGVLVEGESQKRRHCLTEEEEGLPQMTGRTESSKIVHFFGKDVLPGDLVEVCIEKAYSHSLWGGILKKA